MSDSLFFQFEGPDNLKAMVEDNGRVAYAYLLEDKQIVGDVWLYNHGAGPSEAEWADPSKAPFANPADFAAAIDIPIHNRTDVDVTWGVDYQSGAIQVSILIRGQLFAILEPGAKPGWSKLALQEGPLAKRLIRDGG